MMGKLRDWWDAIRFFFKPTFYVVASPQGAMDLLAKRGGTLRFLEGEFTVPQGGLKLPDQDCRIIGATLLIPEGGTGLHVSTTKSRRVIITGCSFIGMGKGAHAIIEVAKED